MITGKARWEDVTQLLLNHHDHIVDFDAEDTEIYKRMAAYYKHNLDADLQKKSFSKDDEKCITILFKAWEKTIERDGIWHHIARHIKGKTGMIVKNHFLRQDTETSEMTLQNIKTNSADHSRAGKYFYTHGHVISLSIHPKTTDGMCVTTKLQKEAKFLVLGTKEEIFLAPCKYSALR